MDYERNVPTQRAYFEYNVRALAGRSRQESRIIGGDHDPENIAI